MQEKKTDNSKTEVKGELEQIVELSLLYDFYGALLKEHKQKIFEDYVLNDYSLSEIAKEEGMTRQGVHDMVKRCSRELREYENKLHLVEKFEHTRKNVEEMQKLLCRMKEEEGTGKKAKSRMKEEEGVGETIDLLIHISQEILDEI